MGFPQKRPLRRLTPQEREELSQKATSEVDLVSTGKRAQALLAVADGCSFTEAGRQAGMSQDGVSQLVERFHQRGIEALSIAPGRGRKPTYTSQDHELILREIQRHPSWEVDQGLIWSLALLQKSLQAKGVLDISTRTIRRVLLAHGWKYQPTTHTWLPIDQGE
jgi:transposase